MSRSSNCEQIVHYIPFLLLAVVSCVIQSIASKNRKGESRQPCRTPVNNVKSFTGLAFMYNSVGRATVRAAYYCHDRLWNT